MQVDIIQKNYPKRVALRDIHLNFPSGRTSLIIGTSGAGKSTLIKCLIGTTSYEGSVSGYRREDIAYIPQHPALNVEETAHDAIYYFPDCTGGGRLCAVRSTITWDRWACRAFRIRRSTIFQADKSSACPSPRS